MGKYNSRHDLKKLAVLRDSREAAGLSQDEVARFFGLKDRRSVGAWELGESDPPPRHRSRFRSYLLLELGLLGQPEKFKQLWDDVLVGEWRWEPLSFDELQEHFPSRADESVQLKPHIINPATLSGARAVIPFLAPPQQSHRLVGREHLLRHLKQRLFAGGRLALTALNGKPGIGKTALALELAHDREVREYFHDGVLWAGLGRQGDVLSYLGIWAAALGISSAEIGNLTTIEARAKEILRAIGTRRMLLVADDVWQVETANAFNLTGPNCAYIVTTRLPEIALRVNGEMTTVMELNQDDSLELLSQLAPEAVKAEPEKARTLVSAVGGLPLAIILMGHYLSVEGHNRNPRRLREAFDNLTEIETRLRLAEPQAPAEGHPSLPAGAWISLEEVIGISDNALDEEPRYALRALSIFPPKPNTFSEDAATAVSSKPPRILDKLIDFGLLEIDNEGRYTMHQAISNYARLRLGDKTAYKRMVEYFVHYVETHEKDYSGLNLEFNNVLEAFEIAFGQEMQASLVRGANALSHFLEVRGLYTLADLHLQRAQSAAEFIGEPIGITTVWLNRGQIARKQGDYRQAQAYFERGLAIARGIGDRDKISALQFNLSSLLSNQGRLSRAEAYAEEGLIIAHEMGDKERICALLTTLGVITIRRGYLKRAEGLYEEALVLAREIGDLEKMCRLLINLSDVANVSGEYLHGVAYAQEGLRIAGQIKNRDWTSLLLCNLGDLTDKLGNYTQGREYMLEGLEMAREIGFREGVVMILKDLAALALRHGDLAQAQQYYEDSLVDAREIGFYSVPAILNDLGKLHMKQQNLERASAYFGESLKSAQQLDSPRSIADALYSLAHVAASTGDMAEAQRLSQASLDIYDELGHFLAKEVKEWRAMLLSGDS